METTRTFKKLAIAASGRPRYLLSEGGTRSGKTYAALQLLVIIVPMDTAPTVNSVVSETIPHLKKGAIRDFKRIMADEGLWEDSRWNETDKVYTFANDAILEFFSADSPGKVHGPGRHRLFVNEGQNIPYEVFRQLAVRTSGMIMVDYNPTHVFWAIDKIQPRDNCVTIHSTYKDNDFLSAEQVAEIESNRDDANWWRVYGEGLVGQLEGVIYSFGQIDVMPDPAGLKEVYGLDFGFTNDPSALVRVLADTGRKVLYVDEVFYRTRMLNSDIVSEMERREVPKRSVEIFADCSEPKSIAEIGNAGYNIKPCDKDAPVRSDKLKFQLQYMQGWTLNITKGSVNVIREVRNYTWDKDKDGNTLTYPIDKFNHAMDALRYAVYSKFGRRAGYGQYTYR